MKKTVKPVVSAIASAVCMGLGQLLNKQIAKGIIYIVINMFLVIFAIPRILNGIEGLVTLGTVPMKQHSLFLMVYGILSIIVLIYILWFYITNIIDAYKKAKLKEIGQEVPGIKEEFRSFLHKSTSLLMLLPGLIAVSLVVILPLIFSIMIGFTDYDLYHQPPAKLLNWVGLENFKEIFTISSWAKTFWGILIWTIEWTVLSSILPYAVGIFLAVILNNPKIKFKRVLKTIYILPWAIPGYIAILVWRGLFDTSYGLINKFLENIFQIEQIPWLQETNTARIALLIVSIWVGFSFPFMISDSIMKSIPSDLYEAAKLDGATSFHCFWRITFPLLMFSIAPIFIMSLSGAFNNFNLIYLFTGGGPPNLDYQGAGNTDILISWLFKMTFNIMKYNYASAISLMIFFVVAAFSIYNFRHTRNYTEEDIMK